MISNHGNMVFQWDWAGPKLINKRILVSPDELDKPQRQLGTIVLPPDPVPIQNARVEPYAIDETYTNTRLMLYFDINLTDAASPANIITENGSVEISTDQSYFGPASAYFDGASYLTTPTQDYFNPTGDFTIDTWVYSTDSSGSQCIVGKDNDAGIGPYFLGIANGEYVFSLSSNGTSWNIAENYSFGPVAENQWTHLALDSTCDIIYSFRDGFLRSNFENSSTLYESTGNFAIGRSNSGTDYFSGYLSYLRFSSVGLWVQDFTPPDRFEYTT